MSRRPLPASARLQRLVEQAIEGTEAVIVLLAEVAKHAATDGDEPDEPALWDVHVEAVRAAQLHDLLQAALVRIRAQLEAQGKA